ncbi:hypothetical protein AYK24_05105 [Thermoplasmatales archaeon SG8-52-4]|nr:MAG: hypothetical protein AYK24_05105 [Thermoplasmatales archaeon SG8-52-4]
MKNNNPWTTNDERNHFPSAVEWWCAEAFFKTVEDNKKWSFNSSITVGCSKGGEVGSGVKTTLFNQENNTLFEYKNMKYHGRINNTQKDDRSKLKSLFKDSNGFYVKHAESYMDGIFPDYNLYLKDIKNKIFFDFKLHAKSKPHWVAQNITDGWLPWGLGFYRYGFIPKLELSGKLKIKNKTLNVNGIGYYEHVWGDWSFHNPLNPGINYNNAISIYTKLGGWWLKNHKIKIPKSIAFTSENNPVGYDWAWAVLDNGWTIFYGNIMLWIMEGPAAGTLILSKDDENYEEYCDIEFKYNIIKYSKKYDFCYPSELEVIARKNKEILHLHFKMTSECREFTQKFPKGKYWLAFVICEAPGEVNGYYFDGKKKIKLNGFCKMEPQRQISKLGHNSLKLDFLFPPKGLGTTLYLDSHFLRKKIKANIQLIPRPKLNFNFKNI